MTRTKRILAEATFKSVGTNHTIRFASSGDEAIAYLKGEGKFADRNEFKFPSFIITDLKMSPGDGFHVLEFLKNHPALSLIPAVMLSTSDDPDDIRQAYLLGASSYFVKPPTLKGLQAIFRKIHEYCVRVRGAGSRPGWLCHCHEFFWAPGRTLQQAKAGSFRT